MRAGPLPWEGLSDSESEEGPASAEKENVSSNAQQEVPDLQPAPTSPPGRLDKPTQIPLQRVALASVIVMSIREPTSSPQDVCQSSTDCSVCCTSDCRAWRTAWQSLNHLLLDCTYKLSLCKLEGSIQRVVHKTTSNKDCSLGGLAADCLPLLKACNRRGMQLHGVRTAV